MSLDSVKNILLILSGKGGVGKSSITTQLALSLSLAGKSVGILDIDLTGPSIPRLLGIESGKIQQAPGGWQPVELHAVQDLPEAPATTYPKDSTAQETENSNGNNGAADGGGRERAGGETNGTSTPSITEPRKIGAVYAMSLAFLLASRSAAIVWRGPKKTAMVRQFLSDVLWPELDYLLIDTPPGTSDEHISAVETLLKNVSSASLSTGEVTRGPNLAGAVIVTTPQAVSISDVKKEVNFCSKTGVKVVGVVENMSGFVCPCCGEETALFSKGGGQVMANEFGVEFLGAVPVDERWGRLVEEGTRPVYEKVQQSEGEIEGDGSEDDDLSWRFDLAQIRDGDMEAAGSNGQPGSQRSMEPGLLVDKYRNCSLFSVFAKITDKVMDIVDQDKATTIMPSTQ